MIVNRTRNSLAACVVATAIAVGACGSSGSDESPHSAERVSSDRCVVRLHGKGGSGWASSVTTDGVAELAPNGNGDGWGGREWRYATSDELGAGIDIIVRAVDDAGCERVVVHGFSNGAAFAAAMVCAGESLAGRLIGVVVDDPVPDTSTDGCRRQPATGVALYWTGALDDSARPGTDCASIDWTCRDGVLVGIDAFAGALGTDVLASPRTGHEWYLEAPEVSAWLHAGK